MPLPPASPEFDLVRLAARGELSHARAQRLGEAASADLDWAEVLRLGAYHKTLPLLHAHLREHPALPAEAREFLLVRMRAASRHALFLLAEMARIGERFAREDIPYVILKGPSLTDAYGGLTKRPFVDNDVLIDPESFPHAERVLLDLDFRERKRSEIQQRGYLYVHGEYTFGREANGLGSTVDVHTRLAPFGYGYAPRVGELLGHAREVTVAGAKVPAPSWEDSFLALSVNALKDQWDRLRLAVDIAQVAACVTDWDHVLRAARRSGVARATRVSVLLAADAVEAAFPPEVLRSARADRRATDLARRVLAGWTDAGHVPSVLDRAKLTLLVQDGLLGQMRYAGYTVVRRATARLVSTRR